MRTPNLNSKRVLIANRGEVAIRIARALKELGHVPIGLWTEDEENAAHLEHCEEWVRLIGRGLEETYLHVDKLVETAKSINADAIHPGHGFLSENPKLAKKCSENKLIFIGPNENVLKRSLNKIENKKKAQDLGQDLKTLPSTERITSFQELESFINKVGLPVILKPIEGVNGRCLKTIENEAELLKTYEDYLHKIEGSEFAHEGFFAEKFLKQGRHIEVEVLENKGQFFHFYERECSIQRRFQKIITEAPSPFVGENEKLRSKLATFSLEMAKTIGLKGAGTFEFLVKNEEEIYFMELNPRMQVSQSATEEVTSVDLAALLIQWALGEQLDIQNQDSIKLNGHAIQCRITAEDPKTSTPYPSTINSLGVVFPQGVRFEHNIYQGLEVSSTFDSMLAKVTTKGVSRKVALRKMELALEGLIIEGALTNIPLLKSIFKTKDFIKGDYHLGHMKENRPEDKIDLDINLQDLIAKVALSEAIKLGLSS